MTEEAQELEVLPTIPDDIANGLRCIAAEAKGLDDMQERCGLLSRDPLTFKWKIHEIDNVSSAPASTFTMNQQQLLRTYAENPIVGIWHTHPTDTSNPSTRDYGGYPMGSSLRYWIVTVHGTYEWDMNTKMMLHAYVYVGG